MAGVKHIAVWLKIWQDPKKAMTAAELVHAGFEGHHSLLNTLKQMVDKNMLGIRKDGRENVFFIQDEHKERLSEEPYVVELIELGWQFKNEQEYI